jgi:hypothetical protein
MRQLLAVMAAAPRGARLATLAVPTTVITARRSAVAAGLRQGPARIPATELVELPAWATIFDALWPHRGCRPADRRARRSPSGQG